MLRSFKYPCKYQNLKEWSRFNTIKPYWQYGMLLISIENDLDTSLSL